jgi:hypothetical protein
VSGFWAGWYQNRVGKLPSAGCTNVPFFKENDFVRIWFTQLKSGAITFVNAMTFGYIFLKIETVIARKIWD